MHDGAPAYFSHIVGDVQDLPWEMNRQGRAVPWNPLDSYLRVQPEAIG